MAVRVIRRFVVLMLALAFVAGCSESSGGGSKNSSGASPATPHGNASAGSTPVAATPGPGDAVPLILVHGITSDPVENWGELLPQLARGRTVFPEVYAAETDTLPTGGIRPDSIFAFGYYRESKTSPNYYTDRQPQLSSIGGCPTPRTDPQGHLYTISFAAQLDRAVENICRATGSDRVDLVCYSMGGIVGRAYTRWLSLRAPNGLSRVRRLLTVGTMNHGLNSLEATTLVIARRSAGPHLAQGEAAELNYQCTYWSGRSYIDLLNEGWDAFAVQHGITYGVGYGYGNSVFHSAILQDLMSALGALGGSVMASLLVHPTPGFDADQAGREAMQDGDGVVRVSSSRMEPSRYPNVRFNAPYYATHMQNGDADRALFPSTWMEQLVRRFVFEGSRAGGALAATGTVRTVDAPGEQTWLALDLAVTGGTPLAAQVLLRTRAGGFLSLYAPTFGVGTSAFGLALRPGAQTLILDPAGAPADKHLRAEVRLFGLDGEVLLPATDLRIVRAGRSAVSAPTAAIGPPTPNAAGGRDVPVSTDPPTARFTWAFEDGTGTPAWSAPEPAGTIQLPALTEGSYELRVRALGDENAAGIEVESARATAIRLQVDATGALTVTR
jgi:hypothetical protein